MDKELFKQSLTRYLLGVIVLGILLFLPAGSFHYWQGWLLMGILFIPMCVAGIVLLATNPDLLRKHLNAKEKEKKTEDGSCLKRAIIHRLSSQTSILMLTPKLMLHACGRPGKDACAT